MGRRRGWGWALACVWPLVVAAFLGLSIAGPAKAEAKPVVLLIHGGGYYLDYELIHPAETVFEARGLEPVLVDYTIGDIAQARRDVRAVAGQYPARQVFAYGESAGGGLAAMLAESDLVEAVGLHSPLVNLTEDRWAELGPQYGCWWRKCLRRFSPALHNPQKPVLALVPEQDQVVDPQKALKWASSDPLVRSIAYPGPHLYPSPHGSVADLNRLADFFLSNTAAAGRPPDRG